MSRPDGKIYVGNLPPDVKETEVEDVFYKFGKIIAINLKTPPGQPPFAFVEFDDPRDAEDAIYERDGYNYDGYALKVEHPRGGRSGMGGNFGARGDFDQRGRNSGMLRRSDYRVLISGLPKSGSWQDLKDHMREAGDVCFADVFNDGTGVVEFVRHDDMKYAARKLDHSKFKSHEGETSHLRIKEDYKGGSGGGGGAARADSRSRSRSRDSYSDRRRRRSYSNSPRR